MIGNKGGQSLNDRRLAAEVRTLSLKKLRNILLSLDEPSTTKEDKDYAKRILEKLTPSLLPRLNEHTGEDGKELPTPILAYAVSNNNSHSEDIKPTEAN